MHVRILEPWQSINRFGLEHLGAKECFTAKKQRKHRVSALGRGITAGKSSAVQKVSELVDVGDSEIRSSPTRSLVKGGHSSTCLKTIKEEMTMLEGRVVAGFLVRDFEGVRGAARDENGGNGLERGERFSWIVSSNSAGGASSCFSSSRSDDGGEDSGSARRHPAVLSGVVGPSQKKPKTESPFRADSPSVDSDTLKHNRPKQITQGVISLPGLHARQRRHAGDAQLAPILLLCCSNRNQAQNFFSAVMATRRAVLLLLRSVAHLEIA
ncbi:hypothetical protein MRB53_020010 [Persea americana]|uniref:Uncharacterized protein n=1 Tax=Persea americana TaxID=3435 RepID=A0ACC2L020_PERAE|nr:hypothetical protein MRB53_020010 [Persea americana]